MSNMKWFELTICCIACWRMSIMLTKDSGPYRMFTKLRDKLQKKAKESKAVEESAVHEGIQCIRCVSVWVAFSLALWMIRGNWTWEGFMLAYVLWMAISGAAILLQRAFPETP